MVTFLLLLLVLAVFALGVCIGYIAAEPARPPKTVTDPYADALAAAAELQAEGFVAAHRIGRPARRQPMLRVDLDGLLVVTVGPVTITIAGVPDPPARMLPTRNWPSGRCSTRSASAPASSDAPPGGPMNRLGSAVLGLLLLVLALPYLAALAQQAVSALLGFLACLFIARLVLPPSRRRR